MKIKLLLLAALCSISTLLASVFPQPSNATEAVFFAQGFTEVQSEVVNVPFRVMEGNNRTTADVFFAFARVTQDPEKFAQNYMVGLYFLGRAEGFRALADAAGEP